MCGVVTVMLWKVSPNRKIPERWHENSKRLMTMIHLGIPNFNKWSLYVESSIEKKLSLSCVDGPNQIIFYYYSTISFLILSIILKVSHNVELEKILYYSGMKPRPMTWLPIYFIWYRFYMISLWSMSQVKRGGNAVQNFDMKNKQNKKKTYF